jgi:hypothetical protein
MSEVIEVFSSLDISTSNPKDTKKKVMARMREKYLNIPADMNDNEVEEMERLEKGIRDNG